MTTSNQNHDPDRSGGDRRVGRGYPQFQLAQALRASVDLPDSAARDRARAKAERWLQVLFGANDETLQVGSRTPVAGVPAWATLEVVHGGFATGALLAEGPLQPHETALLAQVAPEHVASHEPAAGRRALNAYFLSEEGLAQLQERLRSGCYEVGAPEEGAFLAVAWLLAAGAEREAHEILEAVGDFLDRLRFYPAPAEQRQQGGTLVQLASAGEARRALEARRPNPRLLAQREAVLVWRPLYDRLVVLFLETVEGEHPRRDYSGIVGGWPCRAYAADWPQRVQAWLAEFDRLRAVHRLTGKPVRAKDHFAQLRELARRCAADPKSLTGRDVGRIRLILAHALAKHGAPDSAEFQEKRARHVAEAQAPLFSEIAGVVAARLASFPPDEGLAEPLAKAYPVTMKEALRHRLPAGTEVPRSLRWTLLRCLRDTVDALVAAGVATSGEVLAKLLPQIVAQSRAADFADPALRTLYAAVYRAFRRRRSLLLVDLQSQVKLEELPWMQALERFRAPTPSGKAAAKRALTETAALALRSFPQAILPNKLLQELRALVKDAGLDLPLVDELATDIFMGRFSPKFVRAAKQAASLLEGSLYARYYAVDCARVRALPEEDKKKETPRLPGGWSRPAPDPLAQLCAKRAGVQLDSYRPATNGMIVEQEQILTTHNLATLFIALDLQSVLGPQLPELARKCYEWTLRRLQQSAPHPHARLVAVKNCAYAWRQMLFFLSFTPEAETTAFLDRAEELLRAAHPVFAGRFRPALYGLRLVAWGGSLEAADPAVARRFLGWSNTGHWLF